MWQADLIYTNRKRTSCLYKPYHLNNWFQQMWAEIKKIVEQCIQRMSSIITLNKWCNRLSNGHSIWHYFIDTSLFSIITRSRLTNVCYLLNDYAISNQQSFWINHYVLPILLIFRGIRTVLRLSISSRKSYSTTIDDSSSSRLNWVMFCWKILLYYAYINA